MRPRGILKLMPVFLLTAAVCLGVLFFSAFIPRDAIAPRMLSSARFLCEDELFGEAAEGIRSSRIDRYADSILLGIAWQFDREKPLRSVLEDSYYHLPWQNENENLLDAVERDLPANQQYLRYWHGSAAIVRMLMCVLSLPQIYLWHGVLLGLLFSGLLIRLFHRGSMAAAAGLLAGAIGCACWFVPLSLEYTWVFLILLLQLHIILSGHFPGNWEMRAPFFLVSGMLTCYLDFLTCETLTLTVPVLALLWKDREAGENLPAWKSLLRSALYWLAGYAGMFLLKWLLAALVMGENVLPYVAGHIEERTVGSVGIGFLRELIGAPLRNVMNLFPMGWGAVGTVAAIALAIAAVFAGYVYRKPGFSPGMIARLAAVGAVPYARYLVLANHSYLHVFFTFRAQLAALFAIALILCELTGWGKRQYVR